jgi:hypothetical protein
VSRERLERPQSFPSLLHCLYLLKPRHDLRYTRVHFSRPYRSVK